MTSLVLNNWALIFCKQNLTSSLVHQLKIRLMAVKESVLSDGGPCMAITETVVSGVRDVKLNILHMSTAKF